jgi:hypothetical protein
MRIFIVLFFVVFAFSCSDEEHVSKYSQALNDTAAVKVIYTHQITQGYATVYPAANNLFYTDVLVVDSADVDSLSIKIILKNTYKDFATYTFMLDGINVGSKFSDAFVFRFLRKAKENIYNTLQVGVNKATYKMKVSFDPKQFYANNGRTESENGFFIHETDITFQEIPSAKFIRYQLSDQQKIEARKEFGIALENCKSDKEKVISITTFLLDQLATKRGVPSDAMNDISPLEQYKKAKSEKDKVWCGNLANIFLYACATYDIPARLICLGNTYKEGVDPLIYHADHHSIAEVYYDECWHLVDMSFYILDAKSKEGRILNFVDFWHLMNIPLERKGIVISMYDVNEKKIKEITVDKAPKYDRLLTYYKQNQKFSFPYVKKDGLGFYSF